MIELPIILPFSVIIGLNQLDLVDLRSDSVTSNDKIRVSEVQSRSLIKYPIDLLCDCGLVRRNDLPGESARLENIRHPLFIFNGSVEVLNFVIYKDNKVIGALQWFGLHLIPGNPTKVIARGGFFPAFFDPISNTEVSNRSFKLVIHFLKNELPTNDGRNLIMRQVSVPKINVVRPDTLLHNQAYNLFEAADTSGDIKLDIQSDPTQPNRQNVRMVDSGNAFVPEIEFQDFIFDRSGKNLGEMF